MPHVILRYAVEGKGEARLAPARGIDSLLAMTKVLRKHGVGAKHSSPLQGTEKMGFT